MILVDTSVWVNHLRSSNPVLTKLLNNNQVLMHPMIIGELACGNLNNRALLLELWNNLSFCAASTDKEALYFLEHYNLSGRGIGYIDIHLLASTAFVPGAKLWTNDKRLRDISQELYLNPSS
mgnify:CR=1 FL=1